MEAIRAPNRPMQVVSQGSSNNLQFGLLFTLPGRRANKLDVSLTDDDSPTQNRSLALALKDTSPGKTPGWRIAGSYTTYFCRQTKEKWCSQT